MPTHHAVSLERLLIKTCFAGHIITASTMMFLITTILQFTLVYAQSQECIFFKTDGTRTVRPAKAGKNCVPSDTSEWAQNECCSAHPTGPHCAFEQRTNKPLPEWYMDTSSSTPTSATCFVVLQEGWNQCLYILKDGTHFIPHFGDPKIVYGTLEYQWEAACTSFKTGDDKYWYPQCDPKKYGKNPDPPKIAQIPKKVEFRDPANTDLVYRKTLYCYQE